MTPSSGFVLVFLMSILAAERIAHGISHSAQASAVQHAAKRTVSASIMITEVAVTP